MQTPATKPQKRQRWLIGGFLALLLLPVLLWPALRGVVDTTNYENRTLAAFPGGETGLEGWPAAFEAWLGDHAPFRNQLMTANAWLNRRLGTLDSTDVLLGREGWLFLKDVSDSKSLSDYQGLTTYTEEETAAITDTLAALQAELARRGSSLTVLLAPAKEGVYSAYMPGSVPVVARPTRVEKLADRLRQSGLSVVWPRQALADAAATQQVYYKYDTHWNDVGAWLAAQQTLAALGLPAAEQLPEIAADTGKAAPADLAKMSGSWALCTDDAYWQVRAERADCTVQSEDGYLTRYTGRGQGSLLLVRDSFGEALAPHLAEGFAQTLVLHGNLLNIDTLAGEQPALPDAVVLEVGERFCNNLQPRAATLLAWVQGLST